MSATHPSQRGWIGFVSAVVAVTVATVVGRTTFGTEQLADVVMLYLLGIVLVSMRFGVAPSLFAAVLAVSSFDFFFVPPFYTFAVTDPRHIVTFAVMFFVAALISGLTKRVRDQATAAQTALLRVEREQLRNALLSSVSHDLRTPLAVIKGTATTLLEPRLDPASRRELTESIVSEADRMNRLVRNLLDMTRLDAGAVEVRKEWQPVEEAVGAALERMGKMLDGRDVNARVPRDLPLAPYDSILLQQVLVNLLENAVKYTPERTPIDVTAAHLDGAIMISVADRGPGLRAGDEENVFEKLYRADTRSGARARGSFGLGLTICKGIVVAHGGRIWAENREGGGSVFHFTLPIIGEPPSLDHPERAS